ncbi:MAG: acyltransferase family protein [Candidatus Methanomethylophilaceae archaeon]|nr:acyltransferase family protein [Candidatus Methanomethylophilaceae archaeon]
MGKYWGFRDMFAEDRVLKGRQEELDVVRGLSVFLMVGSHVFNQFTPLSQDDVPGDGFFDQVSKLIGAFPGGAQCFMMVMGMVILLSTTTSYAKLIKRGLILVVAGFVLEFLRILPGIVNMWITGDLVSFYPEYAYATNEQLIVLTLFWQDILIFAGMALVFIGVIQKFNISDIWLIAITAVMMLANIFLAGMDTGNDALNIFIGYFWGTTVFDGNMTTSRFPFFSWIVYPVFGYIAGKYLVRALDKDAFYKRLGLWCFLISIPLFVAGLFVGMFDSGFTGIDYYHQTALVQAWCTLLAFDWIVLIYLITKKVPRKYFWPFRRWSRNITYIYILHFVILAVAIQFLPRSFDIIGCIAVFLVLMLIVDLLAERISVLIHGKRSDAPAAESGPGA